MMDDDLRIKTAADLDKRATRFWMGDQYAKANACFQRSLCIKEQLYGNEHAGLIETLDMIGWTFMAQDRSREAEPFYRRSLQLRLLLYGLKHESLSTGYGQVGMACHAQYKFTEAEHYYDLAIQAWEDAQDKSYRGEMWNKRYVYDLYLKLYEDEERFEEAHLLWLKLR